MNIWIMIVVITLILVAGIVAFIPLAAGRDETRKFALFSIVVISAGFFLYYFLQAEDRLVEAEHKLESQIQTISTLQLEIEELKTVLEQSDGIEATLNQLNTLTQALKAKDGEFSVSQLTALELTLSSVMKELAGTHNQETKKAPVAYSRPQAKKNKFPLSQANNSSKISAQKKPDSTKAQVKSKPTAYQPEYRVMLAKVSFAGQNAVVPLMSKTGKPLSLFDGDVIEYSSDCQRQKPNTSIDGGIYPGISKRGTKPIRELSLKTAFEKHILEMESGQLVIRGPAGKKLDAVVANPMRYKDCVMTLNIATTRGQKGG